ncbi:zinc metalloprotease [Clostridia bacterium]|nr:zinc metalloprotease [Clostridia bacterium]
MQNTFYWIAAALLLGVLIMVHELGHFWVARWCGIKVQSFGIGFGPKLWSRTGKDGVVYVLRLLPLGGYCRYYGEDETVDHEADAFYRQPIWKRALSTFAGPLMNLLTALAVLIVLYAGLGLPSAVLPSIERVEPNTPAAEAGLLPGDEFTSVNGIPVDTYEDVRSVILASNGSPVELTVKRGGDALLVTVVPRIIDPAANSPQIGIRFSQAYSRLGIGESLKYSVLSVGATVSGMATFLKNIIVQRQGTEGLVGPIGTVRMVRDQTEIGGIREYLSMAALISINLGFFNLLPIPGLDGSRLLFLLIEKIRRKRMDPNKEGIVHLIGIALLLLLMLPVYINDVKSLF